MADYNKTTWINNETVVDAGKLNKVENQLHSLTKSSVTNAERLQVVEDLIDIKIDEVSKIESDDGTLLTFKANEKVVEEVLVQGGNSVKITEEQPTANNVLWVDTSEEDVDFQVGQSVVINEFREKLGEIKTLVDKFDYAITHELDAGYFEEITEVPTMARESKPPLLEGDKIPEEELPAWLDTGDKGTINVFKLKRGKKESITSGAYVLKSGELGFCEDSEELYIGNKGLPRLIAKVGGVGGGNSSLTGKYLELEADNGNKYRVSINNDGVLTIVPSVADTGVDPEKEEAALYAGLIIRQVYGGGRVGSGTTICSHSYIELYNNTKFKINLKGLTLQYAENGGVWTPIKLRGVVEPYSSFLVRGAEHSQIDKPSVKFKIKDYDMDCPNMALSDRAFKIYLGVDKTNTALTISNPFNINSAGMKQPGYIDLIGVGGVTEAPNGTTSNDFHIDACEKKYGYLITKNHAVTRVGNTRAGDKTAEFQDSDDNFFDLAAIDLRNAVTSVHMPKYSKSGIVNSYYDKLKLEDIPAMITMCYGKDGHTTRTFTWQTQPTIKGYLKYKKTNASKWITIESDKKNITHPDTDATVHNVIVKGLTNGTYVYKVGSAARWSDEYEFEVKAPTNSDSISFLHVTDQQGWNEFEYRAWQTIMDEIEKKETYDFIINTGDISQNGGGKAYEWRYYYEFAENIPTMCHMSTCGNNDLTYTPETNAKDDSTAFTWYSTVEDSLMPSCHSWDYGYCHFVCINSNVLANKDGLRTKQVEWLRKDLASNTKKWTIVYMHEPVYTHTRNAELEEFISVFAEGGVDLVIGGHHHRYTRSKRMGALGPNGENKESATGFYSIMSQATGFKLKGKAENASNKHEYNIINDDAQIPTYVMYDITFDAISMKAYKVHNVVEIPPKSLSTLRENIENPNVLKTPDIQMFDSLIITK